MNKLISSRYTAFAIAAAAILVAPLAAFAQTGYGGGSGGSSIASQFFAPIPTVNPPQGQVLGASAYFFAKTLKLGDEGQDVTELQKILIALGFLKIEAPTGFFGPMTEAAVKAYQEANGLEPVGIVGPLTRALLNKGIGQTAAPKQMSVSELQALLDSLLAQLNALLAKQGN